MRHKTPELALKSQFVMVSLVQAEWRMRKINFCEHNSLRTRNV